MLRNLKDLPPAPAGRAYLALVPHGWARHSDARTAARLAGQNGTRRSPVIIFDVPDHAVVDGMGFIVGHWTSDNAPVKVYESKRQPGRKK